MLEVSKEEMLANMRDENPWWEESSRLPERFSEKDPRWFLGEIFELLTKPIVRREIVLLGPRRIGKTVLVHHIIAKLIDDEGVDPKRILYLQLDNPVYVGRPLKNLLDLFDDATGKSWRETPCYIFFDEIQYLNDWEVHLKSLHDSGTPTRFLVTGSANAALGRGSRESGAGRFTDFFLPPLTFAEYLHLGGQGGLIEKDDQGYYSTDASALDTAFDNYINFGGYPEVAFVERDGRSATRFMRTDIIDKVLLRDLPSLYGITDVRELNRLFTMLAFNSGYELSLEKLSQSSSVGKATLKRYLEYLEAAFLIFPLRRVDDNARSLQRDRTFKVYLTNPSLRTGLFSPVKRGDKTYGHLVETAIFAQRFHRLGEQLHYARWKTGKTYNEIDLVELDPAMRVREAIEIKSTDRILSDPSAWDPWVTFCQKNNLKDLRITTHHAEKQITKNGIEITFEPAAIHAYRLVAEKFKK